MAAGFYAEVPDLSLTCDEIRCAGSHAYAWTFTDRHAQTGKALTIMGRMGAWRRPQGESLARMVRRRRLCETGRGTLKRRVPLSIRAIGGCQSQVGSSAFVEFRSGHEETRSAHCRRASPSTSSRRDSQDARRQQARLGGSPTSLTPTVYLCPHNALRPSRVQVPR
jgi:hypothetical protein